MSTWRRPASVRSWRSSDKRACCCFRFDLREAAFRCTRYVRLADASTTCKTESTIRDQAPASGEGTGVFGSFQNLRHQWKRVDVYWLHPGGQHGNPGYNRCFDETFER